MNVCKSVVLTSLLRGCETWTMYRSHIRQLERFRMRWLGNTLDIGWKDKVSNMIVVEQSYTCQN